jgi:hypothetical protein
VIQDSRSFRYLIGNDTWSYDALEAINFPRVTDAAEYCTASGFKHVFIVEGMQGADGRIRSALMTIVRLPLRMDSGNQARR